MTSTALARPTRELIAALEGLAALPPIEQARAIPALIDQAKAAFAHQRGAAMAAAVDPTGDHYLTQSELAAELGIGINKVQDAIARYRRETLSWRESGHTIS